MLVKQVTMTPTKARKMLENNEGNRKVRVRTVSKYARDMENGLWLESGEPMQVTPSGRLLNGQHRLHACIESGVSFKTILVTVDENVFRVLDSGASRTIADGFRFAGETNAAQLASACGKVWRYENGVYWDENVKPSTQARFSILTRHPGIRDSANYTTGIARHSPVQPSTMSFVHYVTGFIDTRIRDAFCEAMTSGVGLAKNSPLLFLRERLYANKASKAKLSGIHADALTIKALNCFIEGRPMSTLRVGKSEELPYITNASPSFIKDIGDEA